MKQIYYSRYNLKLSLESRAAVSEEEFSRILEKAETEDGNISISGSDTEVREYRSSSKR